MKLPPGEEIRKRRDATAWWIPAASFAIPFLVYLRTAARGITGEDAGELVTAAYELGVPHPPGYPLWCLLAKAFTWIPIGSIAFRVALLSGVFGGLTCFLIFRYLRTFEVRASLALAAALLFGFSRTFWSQAVIPEVYTLMTAFLVGILLMLRRWALDRRPRQLYLAATLFGFGAAHHPVILYLGPLFGAYLLFTILRGLDPLGELRRFPLALACAALPFAIYVYVPLRARAQPFVNWSDPRTADATFKHFKREIYEREPGEPVPPRTIERTGRQLRIFASRAATQFFPPVLLLAALGLAVSLRRAFADAALLLLVAGACSFGFIWFTNFDLVYEHIHANSIFWIPSYLVGAIWAGLGADRLVSGPLRLGRVWVPRLSGPLVSAGALLCAVTTLALNFRANDRSRCHWAEDYARNIFATLEPGALYLPSGDHNSFPPIYLQRVLGERPDVLLADKYGYFEAHLFTAMTPTDRSHRDHLDGDARKRFEERWLIQNYAPRPVYFSQPRDMGDLSGFAIVPVGLLFKVIRNTPEDRAEALTESTEAWGRYAWRNREGESMDFTAQIIVSDVHYARGWFEITKGEKDVAIGEFTAAVASDAAIKQLWNNCGSVLAEHGVTDIAIAFYEGALRIDPTYESPRRNLASSYLSLGLFAQSRAILEDLLKKTPTDRDVLLLLAATYEKESKFQEAVNVFSEVARLYPDDATPWAEAGRVTLQELHDEAQARTLLEHAVEIDPNRGDARMLLASMDGQTPEMPQIPGLPTPGSPLGPGYAAPPVITPPVVPIPQPLPPR